MDLQLAGKAALVTGGSRGIGRAVALRLAGEGCSVGICARGCEDLNRTVKQLRGYGVRACGVLADVAQDGAVERFVTEAAGVLGRIDLLVANVGSSAGERRFLASTPEDWRQTLNSTSDTPLGRSAPVCRICSRQAAVRYHHRVDLRLETRSVSIARRSQGG
ncbi:MAG: SDR family NAD(P)-dependent oxidoreductase [Pseudonocardiaceae bacterium]